MGLTRGFVGSGILALVLAAGGPATAAEDIGCALPTYDEDMGRLTKESSRCGKDADCLGRFEPRWQELLREHPRDMRLWSTYARVVTPGDPERLLGLFRQQMEANPTDPFFATVYGCALGGRADKIAAYRKALELDPAYGWADFFIASLLTGRRDRPKDQDLEEARPHVLGWLKACPGDEPGIRMLGMLPKADVVPDVLADSRKAIEAVSGPDAPGRCMSLWSAEFKHVPVSEHDALRARIRADAVRLKALGLEGSVSYWEALDKAYQLAGDEAKRGAVQRDMATRFPCESAVLRRRVEAWEKSHPRPDFAAEVETRREYARSRYAFDSEVAGACPATFAAAMPRVRSAGEVGDLPANEIEAVIGDYLAALAKGNSSASTFGAADPAVELCINYRVCLDKVGGLIEAWRNARKPSPPPGDGPDRRQAYDDMMQRTLFDQVWMQARADNLLGRPTERDAGLAKLKEMVEVDKSSSRATFDAKLAWVWGEIAEGERKPADALAFYLQARPSLAYDAFLLRATRGVLRQLGASDEALAAVRPPRRARSPVVARSAPWKDSVTQLPPGTLDMVGGRLFALPGDLEGKRTLVNVWATWCGPCVQELPAVQNLYERIKGRPDIAVVTWNVDDNLGVVEPFLKQRGYTFPVAFGSQYWGALKLDGDGIPANLLVDEKGTVTSEMRGFGEGSATSWADQALAQLEANK